MSEKENLENHVSNWTRLKSFIWPPSVTRNPRGSHGPGLFRETYKKISKDTETVKPKNVGTHFSWYENDASAKSMVNNLVETSVGLGYYLEMPEGFELKKDKDGKVIEPKPITLCNEFGRIKNLDHLLPNITRCMIVGGFCPVETKINKFASTSLLKIIHPKTVTEVKQKKNGELTEIIQETKDGSGQNRKITIKSKTLTWFVHNQTGNSLTGLSLMGGLSDLFTAKRNAIKNMDEIIKRYLAPTIIWMSSGDISPIEEAVKGWKPGEDLYLSDINPEDMEFSVKVLEVDAKAKFWEFIGYIDELIWIGINSPNQKYWRNATQASATKLDDIVLRSTGAIQRNVKRPIEAGFFGRYLKAKGMKVDSQDIIPRIVFGPVPTGVEDINVGEFLSVGLQNYYITKVLYFEILNKLTGLDIEITEDDVQPISIPLPEEP